MRTMIEQVRIILSKDFQFNTGNQQKPMEYVMVRDTLKRAPIVSLANSAVKAHIQEQKALRWLAARYRAEAVRKGGEVPAWAVAIRLCKELLPEGHFVQGELQKTDLPDGHFDYIRINNALEHVPNPKEVIRESYRLLKDGGKLMVYVPHGRSLSMRLMKGNSISAWIPFHLQLFTRKSLKRLLNDAGFKDVRIYGCYPTSWLPLSIMQRKMRKEKASSLSYAPWLIFACYPLGWMFSKIGLAEELVGVGKNI